ncbi:NADP-dependent malic enzyme, partial [Candidatus Uhrbacteria bacterium]|nr:NADP-dependent malic enzyme [Candidatus Uhrbacteria bacterium]
MTLGERSVALHEQHRGKLFTGVPFVIDSKDMLSQAYTPGVAEPCRVIAKDPTRVYDLTIKGHTVAVITDGTAVLGLGDIGPEASLPVMEGKCALFKQFGGLDAFPIAIRSKDVDEIVNTVTRIAPIFGGINLEDISAPRCFEIERRLKEALVIPVMHDDQHGTAVVILAGLTNALKVVSKRMKDIRVC